MLLHGPVCRAGVTFPCSSTWGCGWGWSGTGTEWLQHGTADCNPGAAPAPSCAILQHFLETSVQTPFISCCFAVCAMTGAHWEQVNAWLVCIQKFSLGITRFYVLSHQVTFCWLFLIFFSTCLLFDNGYYMIIVEWNNFNPLIKWVKNYLYVISLKPTNEGHRRHSCHENSCVSTFYYCCLTKKVTSFVRTLKSESLFMVSTGNFIFKWQGAKILIKI